MKKEKISLILILGIVGVLVTSIIIDSSASANLTTFDVYTCTYAYGCEFDDDFAIPGESGITSEIEDWLDDLVEAGLDETWTKADVLDEIDPLLISFEESSDMWSVLDVLGDIHEIYYDEPYPTWDYWTWETDPNAYVEIPWIDKWYNTGLLSWTFYLFWPWEPPVDKVPIADIEIVFEEYLNFTIDTICYIIDEVVECEAE